MWTFGRDKSDIPMITFIICAMALPCSTTCSLSPICVPSRLVGHSQAPFCYCTQRLISDQPEGTFERLRYFLGGDRPSQTAYQKLSLALFFEGSRLESKFSQSGISTMTPLKPKFKLLSLPPILRNENPNSISSYSKAQ